MDWDGQRAQHHLESLAARHEITIVWSDALPKCTNHNIVYIRRPFNAVEYLSGLHEMGHIVSPRALHYEGRWNKEYDDMLLMETAAWAWAVRFCDPVLLEMIESTTWRQLGTFISTYLREIPAMKLDTGKKKR